MIIEDSNINRSNVKEVFIKVHDFNYRLKIYDKINPDLYDISDIVKFFDTIKKEYNIFPFLNAQNEAVKLYPDEYIVLKSYLEDLENELLEVL